LYSHSTVDAACSTQGPLLLAGHLCDLGRVDGWGRCRLQQHAFNPFPTHLFFKNKFVYGTVASSPRAATDRLLGCVGTVRIDTRIYTSRLLDPHLDA